MTNRGNPNAEAEKVIVGCRECEADLTNIDWKAQDAVCPECSVHLRTSRPLAEILIPVDLWDEAEYAAEFYSSSARTKALKGLRDVIRRRYISRGKEFGKCRRCEGMTIEQPRSDQFRCLECGTIVDKRDSINYLYDSQREAKLRVKQSAVR